MSKDTILFLCGLGVGILPFLGFPQSWREIIFVVLGIIIVVVAISLRREFMARERRREASRSGVFIESNVNTHGGTTQR